MFLDIEKLIDFKGNRYELARACMEYAPKSSIVNEKDYLDANEKSAIVTINDILNGRIKYTMQEEDEFVEEDIFATEE